MKLISPLALMVVFALSTAAQSGTIVGRVLDGQGDLVPGVQVLYYYLPELSRNALGAVTPSRGATSGSVTATAGTFTINNLPAGLYHLCARATALGQISSCETGSRPFTIRVAAGSQSNVADLVMGSGIGVRVHVLDAAGHISQGSHFGLGAITQSGRFTVAVRTSQPGPSFEYDMTISSDPTTRLILDTNLPVTGASGQPLGGRIPSIVLSTAASILDVYLTAN